MARIADSISLQAAMVDWLGRHGDADLTARTDSFIQLFEADFCIDRRLKEMQEADTATLTGAALPLPDGYLEMIRVQITNEPTGIPNQPLTYVTPQTAADMDSRWVTSPGSGGVVRNYTVLAGQIILTPQMFAPTGGVMEMAYYKFAPLVTATPATNWLLTKYPQAYLYGSLVQAAAYIDDKDTVAAWQAQYNAIMARIDTADIKAKIGSAPLRQTNSSRNIR